MNKWNSAPLALLLLAGAAEAAEVEVRDAVARVTVIPEARGDIKVEVVSANAKLPLTVRTVSGRVIVDGDLDRKIRSCRSRDGVASVTVRGVGEVAWDEMPQVVIRTPKDVHIETGGAVFGSVGRASSLKLSNAGCGDWTIANVEDAARITQAGSGDTRMGSAGSLAIRIAGSGDVSAAEVRNGFDVSIAGSGSAAVRSVSGPMKVSVAGSGDVVVGGGEVSELKVSIAGSGDVDFQGVAGSLNASIAGSGDIHAAQVKGTVSKSIIGSGAVRVGS